MALTLRQAAQAFIRYEQAVPRVITRRLTLIGDEAQRRAVTTYMQGLGSGLSARPANPPPGPIGIRSGSLRRSVKVIKVSRSGDSFSVGLTSDSPYAPIQEYGGKIKPHWINAKPGGVLAWQIGTRVKMRGGSMAAIKGKRGRVMAFATRVWFPGATIPARPFMTPALNDVAVVGLQRLEEDFKALERYIFEAGQEYHGI